MKFPIFSDRRRALRGIPAALLYVVYAAGIAAVAAIGSTLLSSSPETMVFTVVPLLILTLPHRWVPGALGLHLATLLFMMSEIHLRPFLVSVALLGLCAAWLRRISRTYLGWSRKQNLLDLGRWTALFVGLSSLVSYDAILLLLLLVFGLRRRLFSEILGTPLRTPESIGVATVIAFGCFVALQMRVDADRVRGVGGVKREAPKPYLCETVSDEPRRPDDRWVATLGDSSTEGLFVPRSRSYPARLEERLRAGQPGGRTRVVNCGDAGATVADMRGQYEAARAFRPVWVLVYVGMNNDDSVPTAEQPASFDADLHALVDTVRADGAEPVFMTVGSAFLGHLASRHRLREHILRVGAQREVTVVDIASAMAAGPWSHAYFVADFKHPNTWGHDFIARQLSDALDHGPGSTKTLPTAPDPSG